MVYNKFRRGFLRNLWALALMIAFLAITVLLVAFDDNPIHKAIAIVVFGCLTLFFVYDLFFSDVFVFHKDRFSTNKYPASNPKYTPRLFGKASVQFNTITKIEKRLLDKKRFVLVIHLKEEEPLQYVFSHEDTRDFICDKLSELTK